MTFIIALGIIILLLCSASIFKLIQPNNQKEKRDVKPKNNRYRKARRKKSIKVKPIVAPVKPVLSETQPSMSQAKTVLGDMHVDVADQKLKEPVKIVPTIPEMISLRLIAEKDKPYSGYELLQALLSCGMRFGKMNIFHRHEKTTGVGPILFSLAACTEEGTFDLARIGGFSCKGLVLYMHPKKVKDPVMVFETLLATADQLITDLDGNVLNEQQQLLSKDNVINIHKTLQQYVKDQKSLDLFAE